MRTQKNRRCFRFLPGCEGGLSELGPVPGGVVELLVGGKLLCDGGGGGGAAPGGNDEYMSDEFE
jgi:hypothetical protein